MKLRILTQIKPPVNHRAYGVKHSKAIQYIFRSCGFNLFTNKHLRNDKRTIHAATADVQPNTGPACSLLNTCEMVLKVEPLPKLVIANNTTNKIKNGQKNSR